MFIPPLLPEQVDKPLSGGRCIFVNRKSTGTASCFHEVNVSRRHTKDVTTKYHEQIADGPEGSQSFDPETGIPDYQMTMQRFQAKRYDESIEKPSMKE